MNGRPWKYDSMSELIRLRIGSNASLSIKSDSSVYKNQQGYVALSIAGTDKFVANYPDISELGALSFRNNDPRFAWYFFRMEDGNCVIKNDYKGSSYLGYDFIDDFIVLVPTQSIDYLDKVGIFVYKWTCPPTNVGGKPSDYPSPTTKAKVVPGDQEIQAFLSSLKGGPFTFEKSATGNFTYITRDIFDALAASDSNPNDGLLDPSTVGNPKLLALMVQTRATLANPSDAALFNSTLATVKSTIVALRLSVNTASGQIQNFKTRLVQNRNSIPVATVNDAFNRVMASFRPESVSRSIYDSMNALYSGLLQADQKSLKASFDLIKSQLHAVDANYRKLLAAAIAKVHVAQDALTQVQRLQKVLTTPSNTAATLTPGLKLANQYLQAQVIAFGAPRTSDYLVATLLGSDKLSQTQLDQFTKGTLAFSKIWTGTNPNAQLTFDLLKKYDSSFTWTSITQGDFNAFINTRLSCELGKCNLPDNVSDNVLDVMTLLAAQNLTEDAILLYYSSVANQIRQENPDYLSRYYSTDAQLATYSFQLYHLGELDDTEIPLDSSDTQYLISMINDQQLDTNFDADKKVLEDAIMKRKFPQGIQKGEYYEFLVLNKFDPTVGQQSNLGILAATANQAYRTFDANNRPLIQNPFYRANRLASRLSLNYSFTFDVEIEPPCFDGSCPSNQVVKLSQDQSNHLVNFILKNNLDNLGVQGQARLDLNTKVTKELLAYAPTLDKSTVVDYKTAMNLSYSKPTVNYPDKSLSRTLCLTKKICIPKLKDLIPIAAQVMQGIRSGSIVDFNETSPGLMAIGSLLPGFPVIFSLANKPQLNGRQQFVRDWLNQHGRSTTVLDSALQKAKGKWKAELGMNVALLGIDLATFVVPELSGVAALVKASDGVAVASMKAIRLEADLIDASVLKNSENVLTAAKGARQEVSDAIPTVKSKQVSPPVNACKLAKRVGPVGCNLASPSRVGPDNLQSVSKEVQVKMATRMNPLKTAAMDIVWGKQRTLSGYEIELNRMYVSEKPEIYLLNYFNKEAKFDLTVAEMSLVESYTMATRNYDDIRYVELFKRWPNWNVPSGLVFRVTKMDENLLSKLVVGKTFPIEELANGNVFLAASRSSFELKFRNADTFEMVIDCKTCKWISPFSMLDEDEVIVMSQQLTYLGREKVQAPVQNGGSTWRLYFAEQV